MLGSALDQESVDMFSAEMELCTEILMPEFEVRRTTSWQEAQASINESGGANIGIYAGHGSQGYGLTLADAPFLTQPDIIESVELPPGSLWMMLHSCYACGSVGGQPEPDLDTAWHRTACYSGTWLNSGANYLALNTREGAPDILHMMEDSPDESMGSVITRYCDSYGFSVVKGAHPNPELAGKNYSQWLASYGDSYVLAYSGDLDISYSSVMSATMHQVPANEERVNRLATEQQITEDVSSIEKPDASSDHGIFLWVLVTASSLMTLALILFIAKDLHQRNAADDITVEVVELFRDDFW